MLPSSEGIIKALNRIVEVFSNPVEIEVVKTRWEEIKKLQLLGKNKVYLRLPVNNFSTEDLAASKSL